MQNKSNQLYRDIKKLFEKTFLRSDSIKIARAPGRVNIIGEHTDYNGLPVLPTAIDREIAFAFIPNSTSIVNVINIDISFGSRSFELSGNISPYDSGDWGNYIKASALAIWNWAKVNSPQSLPLMGFDASVGGNIPSSSGLSSSSAMVVASAFALLSANNIEIEKKELADLLAKAERYVGTEGGGMDQATSILSQSGSVLRIDFNPIRTQTIPVPCDYVFIIANSLVRANKAGKAKNAYNTRVVECRLGVQIFKSLDTSNKLQNAVLLSDVMQNIDNWQDLLDEIPDGSLSLSDISEFINIDKSELIEKCFTTKNGTIIELDTDSYEIKKRCRHVLLEADRVSKACEALQNGDITLLGNLMNQSHISCRDDYEISCDELDVLVEILLKNGAKGARLTGAGFGGCAISVVEKDKADSLIDGVWKEYYQMYLKKQSIKIPKNKDSVVFACIPSSGAGVIQII